MDARPASPAGLPAELAELGRCLVMGVLNVTPDSFSDGGRFLEPAAAIARGLALREAGADLVDVGGESTRPGAHRIPWEDELGRVLPVVRELVAQGVFVSIDTMRARVAGAALEAGAVIVNDVSGGLADPDMLGLVASARRPYVVMHWRGPSTEMESLARYDDVVRDVRVELGGRLAEAVSAGVEPGFVVLDPGLGFAKDGGHNWSLLAHLDELASLGRPLLVGASRKRFLGALLDDALRTPTEPDDRDSATAAISALAAGAGAWCVRVHEPASSLDAVLVAAAWRSAGGGS
jgi:dihydropteroate synthase